jgi:hypothetical protein
MMRIGRAEVETDGTSYVVERHHLATIWSKVGASWMRTMLAINHDLVAQRHKLKEVTPEVKIAVLHSAL